MGYMLDEDVQKKLARSTNREDFRTYIGQAAGFEKQPGRSTIDNAFGKDGNQGVSCELFVRICELINLLTHWRLTYEQFCSQSGRESLAGELKKNFRNEKRLDSVAEDRSYWKRLGDTYDEFLAHCQWDIARPEKYFVEAQNMPRAIGLELTQAGFEESEPVSVNQERRVDTSPLEPKPIPPDNSKRQSINLAVLLLVPSAMFFLAGMPCTQPFRFLLSLPFVIVFVLWLAIVFLRYFIEGFQYILFSQGSDSQKNLYCRLVWPMFNKLEKYLDSNHSLSRVTFGAGKAPRPTYRLTSAGSWMIEGWLWATIIVSVALMMYFGNKMANSQGLLPCLSSSTLLSAWLWCPTLFAYLVGIIVWPWLNVWYSRSVLVCCLIFFHWANLLFVIVLASPDLIMEQGWLFAPFYVLASPITGIRQGSFLEAIASCLTMTWAFLPVARIALAMYRNADSDPPVGPTAFQKQNEETGRAISNEEKINQIKRFPSRCLNENRIILKPCLSAMSWMAKCSKKMKR